ncbi:MAG: hypothetical protein R3C24_04335 [Cyanobacteriota/Melainabacteria group bacterium]
MHPNARRHRVELLQHLVEVAASGLTFPSFEQKHLLQFCLHQLSLAKSDSADRLAVSLL